MKALARILALLAIGLTASPVFAHEVRPAYLELRERAPGEFAVRWKTPMRGELRLGLEPRFSGRTRDLTPVRTDRIGDAAIQTWSFAETDPLRGGTLRIEGLEATMTDTLVRMEFLDGSSWTDRLTAARPEAGIPERPAALTVSRVYFELGVEHILRGMDHLLFVLALLIITRGPWRLLKTVTAFTVAHSLTLSAAALGFVRVPQQPVEAVIALSIVFVAAEIVHAERGIRGITQRAPWVVAFTFGLLHGFGFAGALHEIGLPQGQIPVALLFFNIGVEAGQILFVAAALGLSSAVAKLRVPVPRWTTPASAYGIGTVAMFWVIQRVLAFP